MSTSTTTTTATTSMAATPSIVLTSTTQYVFPTVSSTPSQSNSSSSTNGSGYDENISSNLPLKYVFYTIAFMGLMLAIFYTIYAARRDRRRRRAARNARNDPEMGERRATTTYRPESGDEGKYIQNMSLSPPQYISYMLDQPYLDSESAIVYPDQVHHGISQASQEQGLIQHLTILGQHHQDLDHDDDQDTILSRPILTTTTTTTTTTMTTTTLSPSLRSRSALSPVVDNAATAIPHATGETSVSAAEAEASILSGPISVETPAAPSFAFLNGRHMSVLRRGLRNSNNNYHWHSSSSSHDSHRHSRASTQSGRSSQESSPAVSRSVSPHRRTGSQSGIGSSNRNSMVTIAPNVAVSPFSDSADTTTVHLNNNHNNSDSMGPPRHNVRFHESVISVDTVHSGGAMTERSESSQSGLTTAAPVVMPPSLYRLRSTGPPPYIPLPSDEAPPLPPSYNTVAAGVSASSLSLSSSP
ncbi:hypothetical protein EDD11_008368 [Mortierella claussenii]|nr:hypothetical protein EDD11_008368 [Mortierella claussenii]